jgi:hypothetical protein
MLGSKFNLKLNETLKKKSSKSPILKPKALQEYITLSPKTHEFKKSNSKNLKISKVNDYTFQSFLKEKSFIDRYKIEKLPETKIQKELNNISQLFGRDLTPIKSFRNKPVINMNRPELGYTYKSYFSGSPKKKKSSLSTSKIFKNVNMKYNFTDKFGDNYKIKKYSKNNVLLFSKNLKPNDSFDEFVKGIF